MRKGLLINYEGKNVYISGGTSGIGLACAELFASLGANLFVFSVDDDAMRKDAERRIEARLGAGRKVESIFLDVTDNDEVGRALGQAAQSFGAPDVLICSAGIGGAIYFESLTYERFDQTMKINLYGTRNCVAALLPFMKDKGGAIVTVSSMSGLIGLVGYTAYASSKFAVVGFSEALRCELKKYGIGVSACCPPQVETPLLAKTDKYKPPETKAINNNAGLLQPEEVARAILEGIEKNRPLIIPGSRARMFHLMQRLAPHLREWMTDRVIRKFMEKQNQGK